MSSVRVLAWRRPALAILAALAFACGAAAPVWAGEPPVVRAAVPKEFPPQYSLDERGRPQGFAIEVLDGVARQAGLTVEHLPVNAWNEALAALRSGAADLIPDLGVTEARQAEFDFTAPVEAFPVVIFVRASNLDIRGEADLTGRPTAAVETNVGLDLLAARPGVKLKAYRSLREALFDLLAGHVDALVYPEPVALALAREAGIQDRIKAVGQPLAEIKRAMAVRKGNAALLSRLDAAVQAFVGSEEYNRIYVKWYGQPEPFWTAARVFWSLAAILAATLAVMAAWRHVSLRRVHARLVVASQQREAALAALEESEAEARASAAEKTALLREIHHRVRNNLQIVSSLIAMTGERLADPAASEAFREISLRIQSLALVHSLIHQGGRQDGVSLAEYVSRLYDQIARSFPDVRAVPELALEDVFLHLDKATPLGLALTEILGNVFRHAFPDGRAGRVSVRLARGPQGLVRITIADDGIGLGRSDVLDDPHGVGLRLAKGVVEMQLSGSLRIDPAPQGASLTLEFDASLPQPRI